MNDDPFDQLSQLNEAIELYHQGYNQYSCKPEEGYIAITRGINMKMIAGKKLSTIALKIATTKNSEFKSKHSYIYNVCKEFANAAFDFQIAIKHNKSLEWFRSKDFKEVFERKSKANYKFLACLYLPPYNKKPNENFSSF